MKRFIRFSYVVIVILLSENLSEANYDYSTGRWLQRDPIGYADGMNLYEYVISNPLIYEDALGKVCGECFPPSDPDKNFRNPKIVGWGRSAGLGSPWDVDSIKLGIRLIEIVRKIETAAKLSAALCNGDFERFIGEIIKKVPNKAAGIDVGKALEGVQLIQDLARSGNWIREGAYLYAYVEYEECQSCVKWAPWRPWVWGCPGNPGYWKKTKIAHRCDSGIGTGTVPGEKSYMCDIDEIIKGLNTAIDNCEYSAKNHPNKPPKEEPIY